jgi:DNA modification methylase
MEAKNLELFEAQQKTGPVECLGMTFENDEARREYFLEELRKKLQDPEFRKIEGFPIGEDEDILALSDPPYYTACPNPFLEKFIECYGKPYDPETDDYHREPFAADVSEGKNDPIYNAHSYHTKVPHKAIMRYILHYTEPGDIVFDGFCGTGMTGVAAQLCGDRNTINSLGYSVNSKGEVLEVGERISLLGVRKSVLNDLSTAASFIAHNYNSSYDGEKLFLQGKKILEDIDEKFGWMYETYHTDKKRKGKINFTVWSEVFDCPNCSDEIIYYESAVNPINSKVEKEFSCSSCNAKLNRKQLQRKFESYYDDLIGSVVKSVKYAPVLINYQLGKERLEKKPDDWDLETLHKIEETPFPEWIPISEMPEGERKDKDGYHLKGITHLHHFYFRRPLIVYSSIYNFIQKIYPLSHLRFFVQGSGLGFTKMNRYSANHFSQVNRYFSGTLYVASLISEVSPDYSMRNKLARLRKLNLPRKSDSSFVSCQSTTSISSIPNSSVDYVFLDPPFGNNLHYSELNFNWEAWLKVLTSRDPEAVIDKGRERVLADYQKLMAQAFCETYRILKPNHWLTVEFHNSKNSVWNSIQEAMQYAGFVVADVRTLDKQQETYKQSIQKLVKQDLVITAYKPSNDLERQFKIEAGTSDGVWAFISNHLEQLPIFVQLKEKGAPVIERQNYLLFDRMVAFHIQRGVTVPVSASEFYAGLDQRFPQRDGMYFLPAQVAEYDRKRMTVKEVLQLELFVNDESTAVQWLRQKLIKKPQIFQEIHPDFLKAIGGWAKHETTLELSDLLAQNFLRYDGGNIPKQIVSWLAKSSTHRARLVEILGAKSGDADTSLLDKVPDAGLETRDASLIAAAKDRWYIPDPSKEADLEKLRDRALLKEFEEYRSYALTA